MKAYKYKLKPSAKIIVIFESWLAVLCELYNAALQERRDAYRINRLSINYLIQASQLPEIKAERGDLASIHSQVIQNVLMTLATRIYRCSQCGLVIHRDLNGAKRIEQKKFDQRKAQIAEMRYFSGLDQKAIPWVLQISTRRAQRELRLAQSWLYRELKMIQKSVNESLPMAKDK